MLLCTACKSPVYKSGDSYFHDVKVGDETNTSLYYRRQLATIARSVKDYDTLPEPASGAPLLTLMFNKNVQRDREGM